MLGFLIAALFDAVPAPPLRSPSAVPPTASSAPAPARSCQSALAAPPEHWIDGLAGQVDGAGLDAESLIALRRARGDGLIVVRGGRFVGADFRGARLHNICFFMTDLSGTDWRGARAAGVGFVHARLNGARLGRARMRGVLFYSADLTRADASGADFSRGRLQGNALSGMLDFRLDRAKLRRFRFDCGATESDRCGHDARVSFRGADLTGAAIDTFGGEHDWAGARLSGTQISLYQLERLAAARLAGPIVLRGGGIGATVSPAEIRAIRAHMGGREQARTPSFDCRPAASRVEREICAIDMGILRRLDRDVAALYADARAAPGVRAAQRAWLRARDRCETGNGNACLHQAYEGRKDALIIDIRRPRWARPGTRALFVTEDVTFDEPFRQGPLYRRLLPVIMAAASGKVMVRVDRDGTIRATGEAEGGNAHLCALEAERLRFDPATGWFSGPVMRWANGAPAAPARPPRLMPVLRFFGERAEVFGPGQRAAANGADPHRSDYVMCGARAGFDTLIRVPVRERRVVRTYSALTDQS
jgi:uncharacterized protein YjbI with pentapeptide repeats